MMRFSSFLFFSFILLQTSIVFAADEKKKPESISLGDTHIASIDPEHERLLKELQERLKNGETLEFHDIVEAPEGYLEEWLEAFRKNSGKTRVMSPLNDCTGYLRTHNEDDGSLN